MRVPAISGRVVPGPEPRIGVRGRLREGNPGPMAVGHAILCTSVVMGSGFAGLRPRPGMTAHQ